MRPEVVTAGNTGIFHSSGSFCHAGVESRLQPLSRKKSLVEWLNKALWGQAIRLFCRSFTFFIVFQNGYEFLNMIILYHFKYQIDKQR